MRARLSFDSSSFSVHSAANIHFQFDQKYVPCLMRCGLSIDCSLYFRFLWEFFFCCSPMIQWMIFPLKTKHTAPTDSAFVAAVAEHSCHRHRRDFIPQAIRLLRSCILMWMNFVCKFLKYAKWPGEVWPMKINCLVFGEINKLWIVVETSLVEWPENELNENEDVASAGLLARYHINSFARSIWSFDKSNYWFCARNPAKATAKKHLIAATVDSNEYANQWKFPFQINRKSASECWMLRCCWYSFWFDNDQTQLAIITNILLVVLA